VRAKERILDACDIEAFFLCDDIEEGKRLGMALMGELGFSDVDVVFCEMAGPGARVRVRGYVNRPGSAYTWQREEGAVHDR
jgi:hypothetical protein